MKIKTWMYYAFSATCFLISAIINFTEGSSTRSVFLFLFTFMLYLLAFLNSRKKDEIKKMLSVEEVEKLEAELRVILADGDKIGAIKKYREITGLGLKESSDYIESILVSKADLDRMDIELKDLLYDGKKYQAISRYREITKGNLQEANDYIDSLM